MAAMVCVMYPITSQGKARSSYRRASMKAVRAHEVGGPEVLRYEEVPSPTPGPGQALVDIQAIGVNYTDVSSRRGTNPPASFP